MGSGACVGRRGAGGSDEGSAVVEVDLSFTLRALGLREGLAGGSIVYFVDMRV